MIIEDTAGYYHHPWRGTSHWDGFGAQPGTHAGRACRQWAGLRLPSQQEDQTRLEASLYSHAHSSRMRLALIHSTLLITYLTLSLRHQRSPPLSIGSSNTIVLLLHCLCLRSSRSTTSASSEPLLTLQHLHCSRNLHRRAGTSTSTLPTSHQQPVITLAATHRRQEHSRGVCASQDHRATPRCL